MKQLSALGVMVRGVCLVALFAATGASEEARAADAYWGHCVQMGIGDPPSIFCECKSGPNQAG